MTLPGSEEPKPDDPGRVLVVDEDYDTLDVLAATLREHGHHVALATDGRSGLQRAVEIRAEVVLVDIHVQILDVRTFVDVLADNPRTADAHVFVLGAGDPAELATLAHRVERIVKPFHAQEVAARVDEVIRVRRAPPKGPELEGDLQQVALFDLLQVFAGNRRTGQLRVEAEGKTGEVWIQVGKVVDATIGPVVGEKALYRILALNKGQFVFFPDRVARRERINASMDFLLMEGVRRSDERKMLESKLPPISTQVHLTVRPGSVEGVRAETLSAIATALEEARPISELLDAVPAHDLEVLRAAAALHNQGALAVYDAVQRIRFCSDEEVPSMRAAALRLRRPGAEGSVRLGVIGQTESVTRFARALAGLEEFLVASEPPAAAGTGALGCLGMLRLGGTDLELFALPPEETLRPWWGAMLGASTAAVVLDGLQDEEAGDLARAMDLRLVPADKSSDRPGGAAATIKEALGPVMRASIRPPR